MLKDAENFSYEVSNIIKKENKKNVIFNILNEELGINHAIQLTEFLFHGKILDIAKIPEIYLIMIAKELKIDVEKYFEKKEITIEELLERINKLELSNKIMEDKIEFIEKLLKVGE